MNLYRRGLTLALVVLMLLSSIAIVSAQGDVTGTVDNFLSVVVLPELGAANVTRLEPGTTVTLIGRSSDGNWVQVETADGLIGWGRAHVMTIEGDVMALPETAPTANQAVVVSFVNLRANPTFDAASSVQLTQGTVVDVVAASDDYIYVMAEAGSGWAAARGFAFSGDAVPEVPMVDGSASGFAYLRVVPDRDAPDYGRLDPGTPFMVLGRSDDGEWLQIETLDGQTGWANYRGVAYAGDADALDVTVPGAEQGVVINFANLYAAPELGAESLGVQLTSGTAVDILFANDTWVYVAAGDAEGWTRTNALAFVGGAVPADVLAANATVAPADNVATVNLRAAPNADAQRQGWANVGERLHVSGVSADGEWYYVVPSSRVGAWVFAALIELDSSVELPLPVISN